MTTTPPTAPWLIHEQSLLACPLVDPVTMDEIGSMEPTTFGIPLHSLIWQAITALYLDGTAPTVPAVQARVGQMVGTESDMWQIAAGYVPQLVNLSPVPVGAEHHAEQVRLYARLRDATARAERVVALGQAEDLRGLDEALALGVCAGGGSARGATLRSLGDVLSGVLDGLEARARGELPPAIPTGFPDLDSINAWQPGDFLVLAARPGEGKSLMAVQLALHAARAGRRCLVASLEMSDEQLALRALSSHSHVPASLLADPRLLSDEWGALNAAVEEMSRWPVYFCDLKDMTLDMIAAAARKCKSTGGLDFLVIDYIQLLPLTGVERVGLAHAIGQMTRKCKRLARELSICILALSQVTREGAKRGALELYDLRDSGAIEADVDTAMLMWPDGEAGPDGALPSGLIQMVVKVAKNRNGPEIITRVRRNPTILRILQAD